MTETRIDTDEIYEKVETFIKQLHEKDIVLNPKAQNLIIERTMGKDFWGRVVKENYSLADIIGEQVAQYMEIKSAEKATLAFYDKKENKPSSVLADSFLTELNIFSALKKRKYDIALCLFEHIERAYINGLIDEIGLSAKLKRLEEENVILKEKNAKLEKLNLKLAQKRAKVSKYLPDSEGEIGDLSS